MPVNLFTLLSSHLLLVKNCSLVCHIIVMCQTSAFVGYCFQGTNLTVTVSLSKLHTQIVIFTQNCQQLPQREKYSLHVQCISERPKHNKFGRKPSNVTRFVHVTENLESHEI